MKKAFTFTSSSENKIFDPIKKLILLLEDLETHLIIIVPVSKLFDSSFIYKKYILLTFSTTLISTFHTSVFKSSCPNCPNRCNKNGRCCHSYCAGGCADSKPGVIAACHVSKFSSFFVCRYFLVNYSCLYMVLGIQLQPHCSQTCKILNNFGECLQKCPSNFDAQPNEPVVVETQKRYQLSRYCVPKCPG